MFEICLDLSKTGLKIYYFCQHLKKAKKWPNTQTILFLTNSLKRPNGNPVIYHKEQALSFSINDGFKEFHNSFDESLPW
jgi:hypothetical protein